MYEPVLVRCTMYKYDVPCTRTIYDVLCTRYEVHRTRYIVQVCCIAAPCGCTYVHRTGMYCGTQVLVLVRCTSYKYLVRCTRYLVLLICTSTMYIYMYIVQGTMYKVPCRASSSSTTSYLYVHRTYVPCTCTLYMLNLLEVQSTYWWMYREGHTHPAGSWARDIENHRSYSYHCPVWLRQLILF